MQITESRTIPLLAIVTISGNIRQTVELPVVSLVDPRRCRRDHSNAAVPDLPACASLPLLRRQTCCVMFRSVQPLFTGKNKSRLTVKHVCKDSKKQQTASSAGYWGERRDTDWFSSDSHFRISS